MDKKFVTHIRTKANIFNTFLAGHYTPLKNGSVLLSSQDFLTQERLCSLDFSNDKILKLIRSLNVHKAHGHDDISVRMIKMWQIFSKTFIFYFKTQNWKKSNIILTQKKNDKQLIQNYWQIFLLPDFGKIFEKGCLQ